MTGPVTQSDLTAAIGPVRGKLDLLDQRVGGLEKAHQSHLDEADSDRAELRAVREWMIRSDAHSEAQTAMLQRLFGVSVLSGIGIAVGIVVALAKLTS